MKNLSAEDAAQGSGSQSSAAASFVAASARDDAEMLSALGLDDFDGLFRDIPPELQTNDFNLKPGLSELQASLRLKALAARNAGNLINFCGAGFYDHFIPAAVDALAGRAEFLTAYTPYQPEASQGTLQAIYEYQTCIARLTDMDAANASLYDGGTALFEAIMMAFRITRRKKALVDENVNPIYREMLKCYSANLDFEFVQVPGRDGTADRNAFKALLDSETAAVVTQNPTFFGCLDDLSDLVKEAHTAGAIAIISVYPLSLGLVKTPGAMGADIVVAEGQSLGLPLSFGGPYLGIMACRSQYVHKMPGRIAGLGHDKAGRRGFVLTLQAREQHIRREKAGSNICSNEALCALRALIYLALLGPRGLAETAELCAMNAAYAWERLTAVSGIKALFPKKCFFNEFALALPINAADAASAMIDKGFAAGFPAGRYFKGLDNVLIVAFTEKRTKEEIDMYAAALESVIG